MTLGTWARLALLLALAWTGARCIRQLRLQYQLLKSLPSPSADMRIIGAPLRAATGVDPWNQPVLTAPPAFATRFILFEIRDQSLEADVAFWNEVKSRLRPYPGLVLVGYCDGWECGHRVTAVDQATSFPLIEYGEPTAMVAVWRADRQGQCLILDRRAIVLAAATWRDGGSASAMAMHLLRGN